MNSKFVHARYGSCEGKRSRMKLSASCSQGNFDGVIACQLAVRFFMGRTRSRFYLTVAASRKPTPAAGKRDTELRDEIDRLRKRLRKQQARLTAHERDATAERETWQAEKHELRRRLKAAESAKSSFEAQIATRVAEQVNAFRRSLTGLTPYIEHTRQALADVGGQPLLERVTALLAEHRRLNEGYASLSALRAELARLEAADEQLTACVEEAVIVLPETEPLRAELRRRRDELQRLIPDAVHLDAADELAGMLLGRVKAAVLEEAPAAALDDIERTVRLDVIRCLLGPEQTERILAAVQRRRTLLEQIRTDTEMAQAESPHLSAAAREPREIWNLTEELQGGTPAERVWLYVDGYNAIRRVASLARIEEQQGLARARDLFCSRCRAQAAKFAHFEIVFDGVGTLSERLTERALTVVFTAQVESSQNADMYLAERLRQARQKAPVIWLVTVDYGLRARVQDVCDAFITPLHFCRFLNS